MKLGAPLWLSIIIFTWGICATLFCTIKSVTGFYVLRFLLGEAAARAAPGRPRPPRAPARRPISCSPGRCTRLAAGPAAPPAEWSRSAGPAGAGATEAGAFPGMWYYLSQFYPDDRITTPYAVTEAAIALSHTIAAPTAALILSFDGAGGGRPVCPGAAARRGAGPRRTLPGAAACVQGYRPPPRRAAQPMRCQPAPRRPPLPRAGLRGWQWLFLLEGLPSVALGLAIGFIIPSSPATATFLTNEEREMIQAQVQANRPAKAKGGRPGCCCSSGCTALQPRGRAAAPAALRLPPPVSRAAGRAAHPAPTLRRACRRAAPAACPASAAAASPTKMLSEVMSNWQIWYLSVVKIFKDVAIFGTIFWTPKLIKEILTGGARLEQPWAGGLPGWPPGPLGGRRSQQVPGRAACLWARWCAMRPPALLPTSCLPPAPAQGRACRCSTPAMGMGMGTGTRCTTRAFPRCCSPPSPSPWRRSARCGPATTRRPPTSGTCTVSARRPPPCPLSHRSCPAPLPSQPA
jgi:hypothetical protein